MIWFCAIRAWDTIICTQLAFTLFTREGSQSNQNLCIMCKLHIAAINKSNKFRLICNWRASRLEKCTWPWTTRLDCSSFIIYFAILSHCFCPTTFQQNVIKETDKLEFTTVSPNANLYSSTLVCTVAFIHGCCSLCRTNGACSMTRWCSVRAVIRVRSFMIASKGSISQV